MAGDQTMSPPEFDWGELLVYIRAHRVVPIVGRDLLVAPDPTGAPHSVHGELARRLADALHVPGDLLPSEPDVGDIAFHHLRRTGGGDRDRLRIYSTLHRLLDEAPLTVPPALEKLAAITDLQLFVSTTFDDLLVQALDRVRHRGEARTRAVPFSPQARTRDLPEDYRFDSSPPVVFQPFGRVSVSPDYVVTDEDMLEYIFALHTKIAPANVLDALRNSHLLFIGCGFPDWLARFFVRTVVGQRLIERKDQVRFVADAQVRPDASLTLFLQYHNSEIFLPGDPLTFVDELHRRWTAAYGTTTSAPPPEPDDMPQDAIFISYSSDDERAATRISAALHDAGLDVWFDKDPGRLNPGDAWDMKIRRHVESCSFFVPLLSRNAQRRDEAYFRKEWRWALERSAIMDAETRRFFRPLILDDLGEHEPGIPREFWASQACRLRDGVPPDEFVARLVDDVRTRRARRAGYAPTLSLPETGTATASDAAT